MKNKISELYSNISDNYDECMSILTDLIIDSNNESFYLNMMFDYLKTSHEISIKILSKIYESDQ